MTDEVTRWFPPTIKPVRVGEYDTVEAIYERRGPEYIKRAWWNGWRWQSDGRVFAPEIEQDRFWRGLARKP